LLIGQVAVLKRKPEGELFCGSLNPELIEGDYSLVDSLIEVMSRMFFYIKFQFSVRTFLARVSIRSLLILITIIRNLRFKEKEEEEEFQVSPGWR
jgi:hypothetical protein